MMRRYAASATAGKRGAQRFAVVDTHDSQQGRGMRRVSFHSSWTEAQAEAKRLNDAKRQ